MSKSSGTNDWSIILANFLSGPTFVAQAQSLSFPLEFRQGETLFNFRSQRGVPISTNDIGSDGRMTNYNESGSAVLLTTNQFRGFNSVTPRPLRTMKNKLFALLALSLLSTFNSQLSTLHAQGTAFTYQGHLKNGANAANGSYDLQFAIYDALSARAKINSGLSSE